MLGLLILLLQGIIDWWHVTCHINWGQREVEEYVQARQGAGVDLLNDQTMTGKTIRLLVLLILILQEIEWWQIVDENNRHQREVEEYVQARQGTGVYLLNDQAMTGQQRKTVPKETRLNRRIQTIEQEKTELEGQLRITKQQIATLEEKLRAIQEENCKSMKEKHDASTETEGAGLTRSQPIQQQHPGFKATAPADLCLHVAEGQRLRCFSVVTYNAGGLDDHIYTVPKTGEYTITLGHSQGEEDIRGKIGLKVMREKRKANSDEREKEFLWGCETDTWGKSCKPSHETARLQHDGKWERELCEGDRLWVEVWRADSKPTLVSPCEFSCELET